MTTRIARSARVRAGGSARGSRAWPAQDDNKGGGGNAGRRRRDRFDGKTINSAC